MMRDPFSNYDQWKTATPYDNDPEDEPEVLETDPYGILEYCIGDGDDFWCFDYAVSGDGQTVRLHAVVNSETGSFIQNAVDPVEVPLSEAIQVATSLTDGAIEWLVESGGDIQHHTNGNNQDPYYFLRTITAVVNGTPVHEVPRKDFTHWPEPATHCSTCDKLLNQNYEDEVCEEHRS